MDIVTYALCNKKISEKYTKPVTGIPKSDLELPVQNSLDNGDEALQGYNLLQSLVMQILPTGSVKDSVVSVNDAMAMNAVDVAVDIDPVQDLHGYDHPWPAGGGKNLLSDQKVSYSNLVILGASAISGQGGVDTRSVTLPSGTYTLSVETYDSTNTNLYVAPVGSEETIVRVTNTKTATFTIDEAMDLRIWAYKTGYGEVGANAISHAQVEVGSTATAYAPYSNICPITGWTGAEVVRTGKNLIDVGDVSLEMGVQRTLGVTLEHTLNPGTYTISANVTANTATKNVSISVRDKSGSGYTSAGNIIIQAGSTGAVSSTFITSVPLKYIYFYQSTTETDGKVTEVTDIQIETGSSAAPYQPYQGNTYPITFPTEAGTVYGGTLDVTTGLLTVDRVMGNNISNGTWTMETTANGNVFSRNAIVEKALNYNFICNKYKNANTYRSNLVNGEIGCYNNTNASNRFSICDNRFSTVEDFRASLSDIQLVYELATPITYQLTPQQVALLLGSNTLYANTGDTALTYKRQVVQIDDTQTSTLKTWSSSKISEEISRAITESLTGISGT